MTYESRSENETRLIARELASDAAPGGIFCLSGELGAGKTAFAKGFAEGLGVRETVVSPTFTIVNEYEGRLPFYHFDVYRVENTAEMDDTGCEEYFYGEGVCLVEWAEIINGLIPEGAVWVTITKNMKLGEDFRLIEIGERR